MRRFLLCVSCLWLAVAACSSESSRTVAPASTTSVVETSVSTTTPPPTTPPPTALPPTTVVVDTTLPAVPSGWVEVDTASLTGHWFFPCCASNWSGEPSPPLPAPGQGLPPDGSYAVRMVWGDDVTAPLSLELHRFDLCTALPEFSCDDVGWSDTELGVAEESRTITVPLDDRVRVVLVGSTRGPDLNLEMVAAEGNGDDLAQLAVAVETAFDDVLLARLAAGMAPDEVVAEVAANPEGGFVAALDGSQYGLSFLHDGAPPLLFQNPFAYDDPASSRGTDVLKVPSVEMVDGQLTVYVYAGYFS